MKGIDLACSFEAFFRIRGLLSAELENLESAMLRNFTYSKGRYHKDNNLSVLVINLDDSVQPELLKTMLATISTHDGYEFYISTRNSNESFIIEVPLRVSALFKEVGGGLFFSYTYAGDDHE